MLKESALNLVNSLLPLGDRLLQGMTNNFRSLLMPVCPCLNATVHGKHKKCLTRRLIAKPPPPTEDTPLGIRQKYSLFKPHLTLPFHYHLVFHLRSKALSSSTTRWTRRRDAHLLDTPSPAACERPKRRRKNMTSTQTSKNIKPVRVRLYPQSRAYVLRRSTALHYTNNDLTPSRTMSVNRA